ncbi:MAG TPA: hypothetical protein VH350_13830 [Candidatus Sulfotelmatobacter sp.]|nr:hypothetical protein [Candidatus Sulfotelmatobacter sp.]
MRRLMAITAFALFLTVPLWAQRGGGGHGGGFGGGHAGGFGGHASFSGGHVGGGSFAGGARSGGFSHAVPHSSHSTAARGPYLHDGFRGNRFGIGNRHGFGNRFRGRGFRNCYGVGCWGYGYPWGYYGYYDPWWGDSGSSYDEDSERERAIANDMNQQSLEEQQMLRQEQADGDRDLYARSDPAPRPAPSSQSQGTPIMPATVLVFRDQHQKEIQNYAIVGQTLWNFAPQHTEKIRLADLDLGATAKANDDRGITFSVPASNEAQ